MTSETEIIGCPNIAPDFYLVREDGKLVRWVPGDNDDLLTPLLDPMRNGQLRKFTTEESAQKYVDEDGSNE